MGIDAGSRGAARSRGWGSSQERRAGAGGHLRSRGCGPSGVRGGFAAGARAGPGDAGPQGKGTDDSCPRRTPAADRSTPGGRGPLSRPGNRPERGVGKDRAQRRVKGGFKPSVSSATASASLGRAGAEGPPGNYEIKPYEPEPQFFRLNSRADSWSSLLGLPWRGKELMSVGCWRQCAHAGSLHWELVPFQGRGRPSQTPFHLQRGKVSSREELTMWPDRAVLLEEP
ncbi:collagen alpha-2(I) chain-like [Enhydra lutris kenyoni]|uniref:Collagen alpha-2(I) chain-like n=1 Tax=Enhydra lutris kenyoni TaxID=391180 RepID=A0A2Y9IGX3_ENHLU|nr:collagen alpha-2(I) chain-like [Enhydra lutris kenyoni]